MTLLFLAFAGVCALLCGGIVAVMEQHPTGGPDFPMGTFSALLVATLVFLLLAGVAFLEGILT